MLGTPDVVFSRWKIAVFVDGVWWHGHPDYLPRGKRGPYWDAKIARNMKRDKSINRELRNAGWFVFRVWDVDVLRNPSAAVRRLVDALYARGWRSR
jgi:DNA mismatch endonuclease (patch repair protein)